MAPERALPQPLQLDRRSAQTNRTGDPRIRNRAAHWEDHHAPNRAIAFHCHIARPPPARRLGGSPLHRQRNGRRPCAIGRADRTNLPDRGEGRHWHRRHRVGHHARRERTGRSGRDVAGERYVGIARRHRRHRHSSEPRQCAEHQAQFRYRRRCHHRDRHRCAARSLGHGGAAARAGRVDQPIRCRQRSRPLLCRRIGRRRPRSQLRSVRIQRPRCLRGGHRWPVAQLRTFPPNCSARSRCTRTSPPPRSRAASPVRSTSTRASPSTIAASTWASMPRGITATSARSGRRRARS